MTPAEFGKRLYGLMLEKGWHQTETARQTGIERDSISDYVRGRRLPPVQDLEILAKTFGLEPEALLPPPPETIQ